MRKAPHVAGLDGWDTSRYVFSGSSWTPTAQAGAQSFLPAGAGIATDYSITFDEPFAAVPQVTVSPSSPVVTVGVASITPTGFSGQFIRNGTNNTVIRYIAMI